MAVMEVSPARQRAPEREGSAAVARAVVDCVRAVAGAVAESRLAAEELALDATEMATRARELRLEHQRRRGAITGVAMQVVALMHDDRHA